MEPSRGAMPDAHDGELGVSHGGGSWSGSHGAPWVKLTSKVLWDQHASALTSS
jgi:hypothetical protein